jgi:hypothetical protein
VSDSTNKTPACSACVEAAKENKKLRDALLEIRSFLEEGKTFAARITVTVTLGEEEEEEEC